MLKKLKKICKECRKTDDPVLQRFSTYVDLMVNYLELFPEDEMKARQYGDALPALDFSILAKAEAAPAVAEPASQHASSQSEADASDKDKKKTAKKAKKEAKRQRKAEELQAVAPVPEGIEAQAEPVAEIPDSKKAKKRKKEKKIANKVR